MRRLTLVSFLMIAITLPALAQRATQPPAVVPMRPPLFLSESWKPLPTPPDDHGAWPMSQAGVASPALELKLYGTSSREIQLVAGRGGSDVTPTNLWTGTTTSPSAVALRDRNNFVDLSVPLAKLKYVVRTSGFHQVRPVVKLASGNWLVGDRALGPNGDFNDTDISVADIKWIALDITRVVAVGNWVEKLDLSKVDEVGFADLMPGSGHGPGGYVNVGRIEVYGKPIKR